VFASIAGILAKREFIINASRDSIPACPFIASNFLQWLLGTRATIREARHRVHKEYARARARAYTMLEKEAIVKNEKRLSAKRLPASVISKRRPWLILARHAARIIIPNNASVSFGRRR